MINSVIFKPRNAILILLIFSLGLYYRTLNSEILSVDDRSLMTYYINNTHTFKDLFFPNTIDLYYRPVVLSSFLIDYTIWRDHESGFHLTNMILHSANVILIYILSLKLIQNLASYPLPLTPYPFFAALLFAIHPINTEAVNFIQGRTDIMAAFFVLISLYLWIMCNKLWAMGYRLWVKPVTYCLSAIAYLMAILSKEVALTFPLIIMLYEYFSISPQPFKERVKSAVFGLLLFTIPTLMYFYLRSLGLSEGDVSVGKTMGIMNMLSADTLFNFIASAGFYFKKLIYPFPLNLAIIQIDKGLYFIIGIIFLISLIILLLVSCPLPLAPFLLLSILFSLLPAIVISITPTAWTPYAERYLYLPSMFFCILVGNGLWAIGDRLWAMGDGRWAKSIAYRLLPITYCLLPIAYCLWFSVATYERNTLWLSNLTIWEDTVKKSPNFGKIYNEYGAALMGRGEYERAKEQFLKGMRIGGKSKPLFNLGLIAIKNNDISLAEKYFNEGIHIEHNPWAYRKLASIYLGKAEIARQARLNDKEYLLKAIENYEKSYRLEKNNEILTLKLGGLYYRVGRYEDAKAILKKAIHDNPDTYIEKSAKKILNKIGQTPHPLFYKVED